VVDFKNKNVTLFDVLLLYVLLEETSGGEAVSNSNFKFFKFRCLERVVIWLSSIN
jgi:hypothetical protein